MNLEIRNPYSFTVEAVSVRTGPKSVLKIFRKQNLIKWPWFNRVISMHFFKVRYWRLTFLYKMQLYSWNRTLCLAHLEVFGKLVAPHNASLSIVGALHGTSTEIILKSWTFIFTNTDAVKLNYANFTKLL